ncbi:MAG: diguanylate cyclase [Pseudomonadota bacterium]
MSRRPGFRGRLLLGAVLPALVMSLLLEAVFLGRYRAELETAFHERAKAVVRQMTPSVDYALFVGNREALAVLAEATLKSDGQILSVGVLDANGTEIVRAGVRPARLPPLASNLQLSDTPGSTTVAAPVMPATLPVDGEGFGAAMPLAPTGYVVLEISRAELAARQREMLLLTLAIVLGGLLLGGWVSLRIAGRVLTRLDAASAELQRQKEVAETLARTDALTGLPNRRAFDETAQREIRRAQRYGTPLALAMTDLDHFKVVNDQHGHHVGDRVLVNFAHMLAAVVREVDLVGRWGGEEFVILMPAADLDEAVRAAERMRAAVATMPAPCGDIPCAITASFGVAVLGPDEPTLDALLHRADTALYRAKEAGRNRVEIG